ncbi:MAG: addiction module protein [Cyanobacteria bacterium P01_A01_bin.114]
MLSVDQITHEALSLPNDLRIQLVEKLLASLETSVDEVIQSEWLAKAKQRQEDIRNGIVQPIPGEEALAQVRRALS